jgi:hypothetical protein
MSKSVEAHLQEPDSERQGPTNRMSAAVFSGSPYTTRATTPNRTERQATSEAADEATGTRTFTSSHRGLAVLAATTDQVEVLAASWVSIFVAVERGNVRLKSDPTT